jgi:hypothetical protein
MDVPREWPAALWASGALRVAYRWLSASLLAATIGAAADAL